MSIFNVFKTTKEKKQIFTTQKYSEFLFHAASLYSGQICESLDKLSLLKRTEDQVRVFWYTTSLVLHMSNRHIANHYADDTANQYIHTIIGNVNKLVSEDTNSKEEFIIVYNASEVEYSKAKYITPQGDMNWAKEGSIIGMFVANLINRGLLNNLDNNLLLMMQLTPLLMYCTTVFGSLHEIFDGIRIVND